MVMFYIAIVSHGHFKFIEKNECLEKISLIKNVRVIVKDNLHDINLEKHSLSKGYDYLVSDKVLGFGENNNYIFNYAKKHLNAKESDWFIIMNPDVIISPTFFEKLMLSVESNKGEFFTPNMFKDSEYKKTEMSIRRYTKNSGLLNPLIMQPVNKPYNKEELNDLDYVEWASGAFLCINFKSFDLVCGFDTKYFMYYEDVDLCYRLNEKGIKLRYLKNIKAIHKGEYKNRSIFSKHFIWYLSSLFKFLRVKSNNAS